MVPIPTLPSLSTIKVSSPDATWNFSSGIVVPIPTFSEIVSAVSTVPPTPTSKLLLTKRSTTSKVPLTIKSFSMVTLPPKNASPAVFNSLSIVTSFSNFHHLLLEFHHKNLLLQQKYVEN